MAKPEPAYPEFLIIGAPQSGADTVKAALQDVPGIWFPPLDNIIAFHPSFQLVRFLTLKKYLTREIPFPMRHLGWLLRYFLRVSPSTSWYGRLFATKQADLYKGELSDEYTTLPYDGVEKIHRIMPKVKLILMVRNPIDRAYAGIRQRFAANKKMPFTRMTKRQLVTAMNTDWSVTHSGYQNALDSWNVFFRREQMFIGFYDDLQRDPQDFYRRLFTFLELDQPVALPTLTPAAEAPFPKELYSYLVPFYRREIEGLSKRLKGAAATWELPPLERKTMARPKPAAASEAAQPPKNSADQPAEPESGAAS